MSNSHDPKRDLDDPATLYIGGVAPARGESERSLMPASVRKRAYLSVASGAKKYAEIVLDSDTTIIGRGPGVDFELVEPAASRQHASIVRSDDGYRLRDLDSTNGTYLHGVLAGQERLLEDGDCFRIGATELVFHDADRCRERS